MNLVKYLKESQQEMKKVVWPSKKEATNYTLAIVLISLAVAAYFAIVDYVLSLGIEQIIQ